MKIAPLRVVGVSAGEMARSGVARPVAGFEHRLVEWRLYRRKFSRTIRARGTMDMSCAPGSLEHEERGGGSAEHFGCVAGEAVVHCFRFNGLRGRDGQDGLMLVRRRRAMRRWLRRALVLVPTLLLHALLILGLALALVLRLTDGRSEDEAAAFRLSGHPLFHNAAVKPTHGVSCTCRGHRISLIAAHAAARPGSRARGSTPDLGSASR